MKRTGILKLVIGIGVLMSITSAQAATITSVANGGWGDPASWDCSCIPTSNDDVIIGNGLTMNTSGAVTVMSITVGPLAVFSVTTGTLTVTGSVTIMSTGGFNNSFIVQIDGDITNEGALSGPGSYCVAGVSTNGSAASMLGPMDFCDLSPPPNTPFVDNNTGFIQSNVLFCQNGICITTGAAELKSKNSKIEVLHTDGYIQVILEDFADSQIHLELIDLQGKVVWKKRMRGNNHLFKIEKDLQGIYLYRIASPNAILDQGKFFVN